MQSCHSCQKCALDTKALNCGVVIDKCYEYGHFILHPLFSGWRCDKYIRKDSSFMWRKPRGNKDGVD